MVAAAVIAVQTTVRGVVASRGFFFLDDFYFTGQVADHHLWSPHYLLAPYNNHLMPGSFVVVWVLTKLWPLQYGPVVAVSLLAEILLDVLVLRLLRALFGSRPVILVPFALFALSPVTLPAFVWWAAALNQLPQQIALVAALLCQVRYLRHGRVRDGVLGVVCVAGGLLFSEKTLLAAPLVFVVTAAFFTSGRLFDRIVATAIRHRRVWAGYTLLTLFYAGYYASQVPSPARPGSSVGSFFGVGGVSLTHAIGPGLFGGPWRWARNGVGGLADPGGFAMALSFVALALAVTLTVWFVRRSFLGWLVVGAYFALDVLLVAISRATLIGNVIGTEYRYVTDIAVVATIALPLAFLPVAGAWAVAEPARPQLRTDRLGFLQHPAVIEMRATTPPARFAQIRVGIVLVLCASSVISTVRYGATWDKNPARPYLSTLQHQLRHVPVGGVVWDADVPVDVAWPLLRPYNRVSHIMAPVHLPPVRYLQVGQGTSNLLVPDASAVLRRAGVTGVLAKAGPDGACGWQLGPEPVVIPLLHATIALEWVVRIGYIGSAEGQLTLTAGLTSARVAVHAGLNALFVAVVGAPSAITVSAISGGATMCTDDVAVGVPIPLAGTVPQSSPS